MARCFQLILAACLFSLNAMAMTSQESQLSRKRWKHWKGSPPPHADIWKGKVIRLRQSSILPRQPYEFAAPLIDNSRIYVGNRQNMFYAISTKPRKKIWIQKTRGKIETMPAIFEDEVYIGDDQGFLYAFKKANGAKVWEAFIGEAITSPPAVTADRIYVLTQSGRLFSFARVNGTEVWHTGSHERLLGFAVHGSPMPIVTSEGSVLVGTPNGMLLAYSTSGQLLWKKQIGDELAQVCDIQSIKYDGATLYVAAADGNVYAMHADSGDTIWETYIPHATHLTLSQGRLFITGASTIYALDALSGKPLWENELDAVGLSPAAAGNGYIAVSSTKDTLFILDSNDGKVILKRYLRGGGYSQPVTSDSRLYILSNSSRLYSFRVKLKEKR